MAALTVLYRCGFGSDATTEVQEFTEEGLGWHVNQTTGYLELSREDVDNPDYGDAVAVFAPGVWLFVREQE
jgi:hypothetical protein